MTTLLVEERIVKSRARVRAYGEVFTPRHMVDQMLNLVSEDLEDGPDFVDKTFLEPGIMRKSGVSRDSEWVARARTIRSRTLRGPIHRTATLRSRRARQTIVSLRP